MRNFLDVFNLFLSFVFGHMKPFETKELKTAVRTMGHHPNGALWRLKNGEAHPNRGELKWGTLSNYMKSLKFFLAYLLDEYEETWCSIGVYQYLDAMRIMSQGFIGSEKGK